MKFRIFFATLACVSLPFIAPAQVDYRKWQSPVKSQEGRGTCTAFAVTAAMETLSGFPSDLSEQFLYAWVKMEHYQELGDQYGEGAFLDYYLDVLVNHGTVPEENHPYNPNAPVWQEGDDAFEKMKADLGGSSMYDLLTFERLSYRIYSDMIVSRENKEARDIQFIKNALDRGVTNIAVGYNVIPHQWQVHTGDAAQPMSPNDYFQVQIDGSVYSYNAGLSLYPDLGERCISGETELLYIYPEHVIDGGHAVSIVGYNATGFLIKNSWGTDWGDGGYGWVSFELHKLLCDELLYFIDGKISSNHLASAEYVGYAASDFWLKTMPQQIERTHFTPEKNAIELSLVFHGAGNLPRITSIEYKIYDSSGNLLETNYGRTHGIFDGIYDGYAVFVLGTSPELWPQATRIVATIETAGGQKFVNTYLHIVAENREYIPF